MAGCNKQVGVKNILITFHDCVAGTDIGPFAHELAEDKIPDLNMSRTKSEPLPGGYTKVTNSNASIKFNVIRDLRVPLAYYQDASKASIDNQIEYINGLVYTALGGSVSGKDESDSHMVMLDLIYDVVDELLPPGALATT